MSKRQLGRSDIHVQPFALGGNVFGWSIDKATSFTVLDAFVDAGLNLIDTADVYSAWAPGNQGGESESIIGAWLAKSGKRDQVVIATKVAKWATHKGLAPATIQAAAEDSLRRLGATLLHAGGEGLEGRQRGEGVAALDGGCGGLGHGWTHCLDEVSAGL